MYTGTAAFQAANAKDIQKHRIRGTIDSVSFSAANILQGSLTISNQISDQTDAKIGSVYVGKLTCTFLQNTQINPRTWRGRKITVEFGLCIAENPDEYEYFTVGNYIVSEATQSADGVSVTAYDAMQYFDKILPDSYMLSGSVYGIASKVCQQCNVDFGMNEQQCEALPNGDQTLGLYTPNDATTYRDIIYWLSVTVGGWATINRNGQLIFGTYSRQNTPAETVDEFARVTGASFSDFVTDFGSASFENPDGSVQILGSAGVGVQYSAGFDPFIQYGTPETKTARRTAIFNAINNIKFMPFKFERISAPIYDLGDIIKIEGGVASEIENIAVIHAVTWTAGKGITLQGFGANPALSGGTTSKTSSTTNKAAQAAETIIKRYENLDSFTVDAEPVKVVNIDFQANRETDVEIWHEIQLETELASGSDSMTIEAVYYFDNVEQTRKPVQTYNHDGNHLLVLNYEMHITDPGSHVWEVFLEATGGTAQINIEDILAVLKGQGLNKVEAWNGVIVLDDDFDRVYMEMEPREFADSVTVVFHDNLMVIADEDLDRPIMQLQTRIYTSTINIVLYQPAYVFMTEDGYNITDETGLNNLQTE